MRILSNINQTEVGLFWLSNNNLNRSFTKLKLIKSRAERLVAFAIIPRYEKKIRFAIFQPQKLWLHSVTWQSRVSYDIKVWREKA